jgi:serine O-acetyltransferase
MTLATTARDKRATLLGICSSDALFDHIRKEAEEAMARDPALTPLMLNSVINRPSFEAAVAHRISTRLGGAAMSAEMIGDAFAHALESDPAIGAAMRADIAAVVDRDPACARLLEPLLYFKGFHAIQSHRLAHFLWMSGARDFALYLQSRASDTFQSDIHPAARFGSGIFLDHATGFVVGETTIIEDNVSVLQDVTLVGTGKVAGDRHPKVRRGVMIGAGAKVLGNIEIGQCSRIAAGSMVLQPVPPNATVAGVPAKVVGLAGCAEPSRDMDQILRDLAYDSFTYVI